ncbi:amiloride-sensitive sodium channel subunit alpha-like [Hypanus sabinus]|uniref:amiloride-sensitive sodium channel subunit alpha-like n=2 Tax=Hypanus sabinus TaxID=79690 RepID=UPI0028C3B817|nr:amiloride-sensitive sodium channel subunit alpha-like [Hypanus sabinus]
MPGKGNGLSLLLNTAQMDRTPFLTTSAGARVMVHSPDTVPFLEDGGFDIQPGLETSISMHKEEVSRLGGQYGDCTWDGSELKVTNLYRGAYTQQACLRSCFQLTMVSRCGCAHYSYPLPPGSEYCDSHRHRGWGHCYFQLYKEYTGDVLGCFQTCRKPCR